MDFTSNNRPHQFHIPVMGTGFSIDTPLKVAKYGISSVVSLVDDVLIEQMRKFHCERLDLEYIAIPDNDKDARANRITAYLELMDELIRNDVIELQSSPFEAESNITRYYEMLPDSPLKDYYLEMTKETNSQKRFEMQKVLRSQALPGTIDVNIMTKLDRDIYQNGNKLSMEYSDAMAALRGYAKSKLQSSIIFSAGFNQRLYGYLSKFEDFFSDAKGLIRKKIVLKVSDFRSAMIQGKYLAKRGLWVSEYRIESGLNCGGHAFATDGFMMGPILEEFKRKKVELVNRLHDIYNKALTSLNRAPVQLPHEVLITVQGGIGTADEKRFLMEYYGVDGTGWGTPFLLVPEVTNVDNVHLNKLSGASENDVFLSDRSPLGIPFWNLRDSESEKTHSHRINSNKPGSPCPKGYLVSNSEFTSVPVCHASRTFQKRKLKQIDTLDSHLEHTDITRNSVVAKSCICHDLAGGATLKHGIDRKAKTAVCCGPNIVNFSKISSLEEMVSHIYGRLSLISDSNRSHMFIKELSLYVDHLRNEINKASEGLIDKTAKNFQDFKSNLLSAIEYYQNLAEQFSAEQKEKFLSELDSLFEEIDKVLPKPESLIPVRVVS
jgi:hypothetical protein